jgi:hypothetical protein
MEFADFLGFTHLERLAALSCEKNGNDCLVAVEPWRTPPVAAASEGSSL